MKKLLTGILLLLLSADALAKDIDMTKSKGTDQNVIVSLTPSVADMDVDKDVILKAVFNVDLDEKHVKKNDIKLKYITQTKESIIDGEVEYIADEKTVTFSPSKLLEDGFYEIEFKSLKTFKEEKDTQIKEIKYRFYVPEVINGYKLPIEPDPALNNATLLGIDSNDNGIRDDVERKIINTYKEPIKIELMLSHSRAHQKMLHDPIGLALESQKNIQKIGDCNLYLMDVNLEVENYVEFTENNMYNTRKRVKAYLDYNKALSGGVYGSGPADWNAEACDFDVENMLKDRK